MPPINGWKTGAYKIRNKVNGKVYIGGAYKSLAARIRRHKCLLGLGKHHNKHLQSAWDKYGARNFEFSVLGQQKSNGLG